MVRRNPDEIRKEITDRMIEALQKGVAPWRKPWACGLAEGIPANFQSGRCYTGINWFWLAMTAYFEGYSSRHWGTNQGWLKNVGGIPKDGEPEHSVVFFTMLPRLDEQGHPIVIGGHPSYFRMMREYPVLHACQLRAPTVAELLDGRDRYSVVKSLLGKSHGRWRKNVTSLKELREIANRYVPKRSQPGPKASREEVAQLIHAAIERKLAKYRGEAEDRNQDPDFGPAEKLIANTGADIKHVGSVACYKPWPVDKIDLPPKRKFDSISDYYLTAFHELAHWSLAKHRGIARQDMEKKNKYAFEELVAEISACFLAIELNVPLAEQMLERSQAYVGHWLKGMGNDPRFIFDAASQASKVVDYLKEANNKKKPKKGSDSETKVVKRDVA